MHTAESSLCARPLRPGALLVLAVPPRADRPRHVCLDCAVGDHHLLRCGIGAAVVIPVENDQIVMRTGDLSIFAQAARDDARILLDAMRSARRKHDRTLADVLPRLHEAAAEKEPREQRLPITPVRIVPVVLEQVVAGKGRTREAVAAAITTGAGRHGVWGLTGPDVQIAVYERLLFAMDRRPDAIAKELLGTVAARRTSAATSATGPRALPRGRPRHADPTPPLQALDATCEALARAALKTCQERM